METTTLAPTPTRARLVGNRITLFASLLVVAEFIGIIGSGVHTMPLLPGADSAHALRSTYAGQIGVIGFLIGWYSLTSSGRVLFVLGVRDALRRSGRTWLLLDYAVLLMSFTVVSELAETAACAGAAVAVQHGDVTAAAELNAVAHYLLIGIYGPGGLAGLILGLALLRAGGFPRVLAGLAAIAGLVGFLAGTLLGSPGLASLQDGLTVVALPGFLIQIAVGVVLYRNRYVAIDAAT